MFHNATKRLAFAVVGALACSGTDTPAGVGNPPPPPPPNTVEVQNNYFNPVLLRVAVGTRVTWDWPTVSRRHNILPEGNGTVPNSPPIVDGPYTYSYTFTQVGTYDYYCLEHGGMRGTVVVE